MKKIGLILFAALNLICIFTACKKEEDPSCGRYTAIACIHEGENIGVEGEYLQLNGGGKGTLFFYNKYDITWQLSGTDLSVQIGGKQYDSLLADDTLVFDLDGLTFICTKDGVEKPIDKYLAAYKNTVVNDEALYITNPLIYEDEELKITASDITHAEGTDLTVEFTVVNETGKDLSISTNDVAVNGYVMKGYSASGKAQSGETVCLTVTVPKEKLEFYNLTVMAAVTIGFTVSGGNVLINTGDVEIPTNNYGYVQDQMCSVLLR